MKKTLSIISILAIIFVVGFGIYYWFFIKVNPYKDIIGKWKAVETVIVNKDNSEVKLPVSLTSNEIIQLTFNADGTFLSNTQDNGNYTLDIENNTLQFNNDNKVPIKFIDKSTFQITTKDYKESCLWLRFNKVNDNED
jgi:flagellar basal body-associated protein FliL